MHNFSDKDLLLQISKNNQTALEILMRRYERSIFNFALKLVKSADLAEEITQDVFIKLWEKRSELKNIESPSAWLFKISRNKSFNHLKELAAKFTREHYYSTLVEVDTNGEDDLNLKNLQALITDFSNNLSPKRKEIFQLKTEKGLSNEEIGSILQISPNTVKNQLSKSHQLLRKHISDYMYLILLLV